MIVINIRHRHERRVLSRAVVYGWLQCPVAIAQQDGHNVRRPGGGYYIHLPITIEVSNCHRVIPSASGVGYSRPESSIALVEENCDIVTACDHQVELAIAVEIGHGYATRTHAVRSRRLKCTIPITQKRKNRCARYDQVELAVAINVCHRHGEPGHRDVFGSLK